MRETNSFISSPHVLRLYLAAAPGTRSAFSCVRPREILMHRQTEMTCRCAEGDFTRKVIIKTYPPLRGCMRWCRCILSVLPVLPPRHAAVRSRRRGRTRANARAEQCLSGAAPPRCRPARPCTFSRHVGLVALIPSDLPLYTSLVSRPVAAASSFALLPEIQQVESASRCFGSSLPFGRPGTHARPSGALCSGASASQAPVAAYEAAVVVCQGRSF